MTYHEGALAAPIPEISFDPAELLESLRRTHDAVQLSFADPSRPESLVEQRNLFWGIINTAIVSPLETYDADRIRAFAEIVDYAWYRAIDSPRGSDALLVYGLGNPASYQSTAEGEAYLLLNEDVVSDRQLGNIRKVLDKYGFDMLISIREQSYRSQQGLWQEALHDQITLTPSARWIREVCAGTKTDMRLTRAEYLLKEAVMQGSIMHEVRQATGSVDRSMYYSPMSSRRLRRISFDLDDMPGSRNVNVRGARAQANQLESLREAAVGLLVRGHDDVKRVVQDGEQVVVYGSAGVIAAYGLHEIMDKLHSELGKTNNGALNGNAIEHLAALVSTLFGHDTLNGQPYDAIVGDAIDRTRRIIERGFRLESLGFMVDALNQLKTPTPYIKSNDSGGPPPVGVSVEMPLYALRNPDPDEKLLRAQDLFRGMEAYLLRQNSPPLLETVTQSYGGLLKEARDLLLLDVAMPEEQVFAALKSSHLRQDSLLVSTIGMLYSAKSALSEGREELDPKIMQDLRSIQARLDMLSSLKPTKGPSDEIGRMAAAVQSALTPLRPLYESGDKSGVRQDN